MKKKHALKDQIRLFLDENINPRLVSAINKHGFISTHIYETHLRAAPDVKILEYAYSLELTILTFNTRHFRIIHNDWVQKGKEHAGIIVSTEIPFSELLRRILILLNKTSKTEIKSQLRFLSEFSDNMGLVTLKI